MKLLIFIIFFSSHLYATEIIFYGSYYECQKWVDMQEEIASEKQLIVKNMIINNSKAWLAGYMSAFNELTETNPKYSVRLTTLYDYVIMYCHKNTSHYLSDAVISMTKQLKKEEEKSHK
ncbi:hypothetical protein H4F52_15600 [Pectobacterium brasiliense]|uniref:hypothetical protein n=1 Tax=Pectobacterium brasiliense TaxID=180957 RepID=UPI001969828F|nr:hypothetical protein [Pectobacterium brasiliense]MBN3133153.1 hypothetical protein [Pectobacterium brasiliense]